MKEVEEENIEIRCLGHMNKKNGHIPYLFNPPYCDICIHDEENKKCLWYEPIKIQIYNPKNKGID